MFDISNCCLGRKAIKSDSRTLKLSSYLTGSLPPAPPSLYWSKGNKNWGQMLNDQLGCCTIAGAAHAIQVWSRNSGTQVTLPDSIVLQTYKDWDGYNPATDAGGIELDVLTKWQKSSLHGHKLLAFASVDMSNITEVKQAISLFGGLYIGVALPKTAQKQVIWDVDTSNFSHAIPGSWGGHCTFAVDYTPEGVTVITWGTLKTMTWAFWLKYVDEAYALLSQDFINEFGKNPDGFDIDQLMSDLKMIQ